MKIFYTDIFPIPLPEHHSFPKDKYSLLRKRVLEQLDDQQVELRVPEPATDEDILRAHDSDYIRRFINGELSAKEVRRVGLPWSEEIVKRTRHSVGGTIAACRTALEEGTAVNLGGGTHHAFRDHGQGYCWLNDIAIAARAVQAAGLVRKVLIIDCDVHQGNGTAAILKDDDAIFTFSIHGKNNFPYRKEKSNLDVELPDGTEDAAYLAALDEGIVGSMENFSADLVIYLAGADPYREDRFGRLALTKEGLARRDRLVLQHCREAGLPAAVTMAGGYARNLNDIVDINFQTILSALEFAKLRPSCKKNLSKRSRFNTAPTL
jgi:acetoin utilization deacetylase AcuC-like enzyme